MDSRLVEYLTWFKKHEKGMNARNNLASSAVFEPENAILDIVTSQEFSNRLNMHDPWWHPALLHYLRQAYHIAEGRELVITNGASGAIWLVFQALVSPGSHVIVETPVYQPLLSVPKFLNAEISLLERKPEVNYEIDRDGLESLLRPDTKLIVLTNLHNPSGYPLSDGILNWLKGIVNQHGKELSILFDETFRDLLPGKREVAAYLDERFISINTLSKVYGLAAVRCGWIISSQESYEKIRDTFVLVENSGSPITESLASLAIERLDSYQQRAQMICKENYKIISEFMSPLLDEGRLFGKVPSYGCLYFPRIAGLSNTDEFTQVLRDSWDIYVVPGCYFGAPQHIRIGFGGDTKHLPDILKRFTVAIRSWIAPADG